MDINDTAGSGQFSSVRNSFMRNGLVIIYPLPTAKL